MAHQPPPAVSAGKRQRPWVCPRCKERIPDDRSAAAGKAILDHLQFAHTFYFSIVMREAAAKLRQVVDPLKSRKLEVKS